MNTKGKNQSEEKSDEDKAFDVLMTEAQRNKLKIEWKEELKKLDRDAEKKPNFRLYYKIIGIAASLILGFVFITNLSSDSLELNDLALAMVMDTEVYHDIDVNPRGANDQLNTPIDPVFKKIQNAINEGSYDIALGHYKDLESKMELSNNDKFTYGVLIIKSTDENYSKAAKLFDEVVLLKDNYYQEALWFSGLAHALIGNIDEAKPQLNRLLEFDYKKEEAQRLLEKLNN